MRFSARFFPVTLLVLLIFTVGCARQTTKELSPSAQVQSSTVETVSADPAVLDLDNYDNDTADAALADDPLEGWNRFWFRVNDWFIQYMLKPIHKAYMFVVPDPIRSGIHTFAYNLAFPVRMTNSLLQGEFAQAGVEFDRSLVNFMVSLGFADVASQSKPLYPYHPETETFDHTLAVWGLPDGPYLMLPLLGPSTPRAALGLAGDSALKPQNYMLDWPITWGSSAYFAFNSVDELYKPYDQITESALEPYIALRNGYLNLRRNRQAQTENARLSGQE